MGPPNPKHRPAPKPQTAAWAVDINTRDTRNAGFRYHGVNHGIPEQRRDQASPSSLIWPRLTVIGAVLRIDEDAVAHGHKVRHAQRLAVGEHRRLRRVGLALSAAEPRLDNLVCRAGRQREEQRHALSAGDAHTHPVTQPDRQLAKGLSRHLDLLKRFAVHQVHQSTISVEQGVVLRRVEVDCLHRLGRAELMRHDRAVQHALELGLDKGAALAGLDVSHRKHTENSVSLPRHLAAWHEHALAEVIRRHSPAAQRQSQQRRPQHGRAVLRRLAQQAGRHLNCVLFRSGFGLLLSGSWCLGGHL
mmetsp:Transcript_19005/g.62897  ORF Transcript_19005/g.62897 Transcript_19005/m.62897 type:complete len:303 (+) Transcript_19005:187-1095(+)